MPGRLLTDREQIRGGAIESHVRNRSAYLLALLTVASVMWVGWRVHTAGFQWRTFAATFLQLESRWLAGALACILLTYWGRAVRWRVLLAPLAPASSGYGLLAPTVIGFTAVVLFGRAGELVRPYLIARKYNVSFTSQLAAWLVERVYDLLLVVVLFGFALSQMERSHAQIGPKLEGWLEAGGYAATLLALFSILALLLGQNLAVKVRTRVLPLFRFLPEVLYARLDSAADAFVAGLCVTRDLRGVVLLTVYTILEWLLVGGCYFCLLRSFPFTAGLDWVDVLLYLGCVCFGSIVQLPGVGGGMQLASVVVLTELFQFPLEQATSLSLVVWAVTFLVIVPMGVWAAVREGISWRKLKDLEKASIR